MGDAIARLEQLRDRFAAARKRLEAVPKTGLSDTGQPYIREIVEALQSFAEWFGSLTLDDMSLSGSAYRVCDAVNGLDAIADWVGLHRSQQFAADIREHVGELVEQSEALDKAVCAAFTVKRTPAKHILSRSRRIPQSKRDAIEDGIEAVASLAGHLGIRLQRIALMTDSRPVTPNVTKQKKRRDRKGGGGRPDKWPKALKKQILSDHARYLKGCKGEKPMKQTTWVTVWATKDGREMTRKDALALWRAAKREQYR